MDINPSSFLQHENARLKSENEELNEEVHTLRNFVKMLDNLSAIGEQFTSNEELMPFLNDVMLNALKLLNAPDGSLALIDEETDELVFMIVCGALSEDLTGYRMPSDQGIAGWVLNHKQPALVRDVRVDERFSHMIDEEFKFRTLSIAAAPLIGDRKTYGIVEVLNQPGDEPFSETDVALLRLLCRVAGEALADVEKFIPEDSDL